MGGGVGGGAVGRVGGGEEGVGVGVLPYCHRRRCVESRLHLTSPHLTEFSKVKKSQTLDQIRDAYLTSLYWGSSALL
jgi:hypothetical protein